MDEKEEKIDNRKKTYFRVEKSSEGVSKEKAEKQNERKAPAKGAGKGERVGYKGEMLAINFS
jgi:hypothetical protein